jgi:hypothetical protein
MFSQGLHYLSAPYSPKPQGFSIPGPGSRVDLGLGYFPHRINKEIYADHWSRGLGTAGTYFCKKTSLSQNLSLSTM